METFSKEQQETLTPSQALELLKKGNKRFVQNRLHSRDLLSQAKQTATSQHPFAVILSCIDSRTGVEYIFDQGIGDIFSIRVAGNIVNQDILGSMEFATKVAGAKLIVVLGHSSCGAVKGACDHVKMGNLSRLLSRIKPAVQAECSIRSNRNSSNGEFVEKVASLNVKMTVDTILAKSRVIHTLVKNDDCSIVGGMHDLATGKVHFDPPQQ